MSVIRFTLISFLFLWWRNVGAQEVDLFEEERAYKMAGGNTGLFQIYRNTPWTSPSSEPLHMDEAPDTLSIKFQRIEVSSFRFYFDESFFDSAFAYYNSSDFEQLNYRHPDSLETQYNSNLQTYYKLSERCMVLFKPTLP